MRKEGEFGGVARDRDHRRIDLEDRPVLAGPAIAGQRARPQADDADRRIGRRAVERQAHPRIMPVIGRRVIGMARVGALQAVQRRAVREPPLVPIGIVGDGVDAEIAAHAHVGETILHRAPPADAEHQHRKHRDIGPAPADHEQADGEDRGTPPDRRALEAAGPVADHAPRGESGDRNQQRDGHARGARREAEGAVPRDQLGQRQQQRRGEDEQRMFVHPVEDERRDERREQPAEHPAGGHDQIEERQMPRRGSQVIEIAVQCDRDDEQHRKAGKGDHHRSAARAEQREPADPEQHRRRDEGDDHRQPRQRRKGDDEAEQVEAEREHPQERHGDDIGGQVGRGREHQARRDRGDRQPVKPTPPSRARFVVARGLRHWRLAAPARRGACRDQQEQQRIARGPPPALRRERHRRLDEGRIADQPGEATEIRRRIEEIGIAGARIGGEPALHQRGLRRHRKEDRPDRGEEQERHPKRLLPRCRRRNSRDADREPQRRHQQQAKMDHRLPPHREAPEPVRIGVAAEQQRLVDEHRAVPDRGRAAEPRQHHARHHRLDEEQQETADEDRQHEQPAARRCGGGHARFAQAPSRRAAWRA